MAETYFLDTNDDPDLNGTIYCKYQYVNAYLSYYGAGNRWSSLTVKQKEALLVRQRYNIDFWFNIRGTVVNDAQPLKFPRTIQAPGESYSIEAQKTALVRFTCIQIEYELQKMPPGMAKAEQGTTIAEPSQAHIAPEAYRAIERFIIP